MNTELPPELPGRPKLPPLPPVLSISKPSLLSDSLGKPVPVTQLTEAKEEEKIRTRSSSSGRAQIAPSEEVLSSIPKASNSFNAQPPMNETAKILARENPALYKELYENQDDRLVGDSYNQLNKIYDSMPIEETNPSPFERLSNALSGNEWTKLIGYIVLGAMLLVGMAWMPLMMTPPVSNSQNGEGVVLIDPLTGLPIEDSPVSPEPQPLP